MDLNEKGNKKYAEYLASSKWYGIRIDAFRAFCDECAACGRSSNLEGHHWRYPQDLDDDCVENVIPLCRDCHQSVHDEFDINDFINPRWESRWHIAWELCNTKFTTERADYIRRLEKIGEYAVYLRDNQ
jgi:hypothetical protein